ncbi:TIGR00153 family protein [Waddlia chondrophila]|nr:TIGR00153 family protein [Waddlia chondrophila]
MNALLNLFGRSPFSPLDTHMEEVSRCVYLLRDLFKALKNKDYEQVEKIAQKISKQEHQADLTKNDLRNHLPKRIFLPIARESLLHILAIQDSIADRAEDVAVLTTLKELEMIELFRAEFDEFLDKNIETFEGAKKIIKELHELLETTFGGVEAEKVRQMVHQVAIKEHEADVVQRKMLKALLKAEGQMSYTTFHVWQKILEELGAIADLSENLAYQVRMTLELK